MDSKWTVNLCVYCKITLVAFTIMSQYLKILKHGLYIYGEVCLWGWGLHLFSLSQTSVLKDNILKIRMTRIKRCGNVSNEVDFRPGVVQESYICGSKYKKMLNCF